MLAIIIPAHNEADHIAACVSAARRAADHLTNCSGRRRA